MNTDQPNGTPAEYATLDPRTRRACAEYMHITAHGPGIYRVKSQSGATYIVDLPSRIDDTADRSSATCTCPDYKTSIQEDDCKHIRCVKLDIAFGELPKPEEVPTEIVHSGHGPTPSESASRSSTTSVATDGGAVESIAGLKNGNGSDSPSADSPSDPGMEDEPFESAIEAEIYHRIAERIYEIETEVDQRRSELQDLETTLSVFEEFQRK